jgi:hypothetical protein
LALRTGVGLGGPWRWTPLPPILVGVGAFESSQLSGNGGVRPVPCGPPLVRAQAFEPRQCCLTP